MMRLDSALLVLAVLLAPATGLATCPSGDVASCGSRCDAGDAASCASLGAVYMQGGNGVARNDRRAVELLRKACDGGSARGCSDLRTMYSAGRGVGRDYDTKDVERYQRACGTGLFASCADLGRMYQYGRGVARDQQRAMALYRKACDAGHMGGCHSACQLGDATACARAQKSPIR
jgi:TPR repeat protein